MLVRRPAMTANETSSMPYLFDEALHTHTMSEKGVGAARQGRKRKDPGSAPPAGIEFRRFRVVPRRRELLVEGRPNELGGRAFDVLMVLIGASGAVVRKDTLMERVWP